MNPPLGTPAALTADELERLRPVPSDVARYEVDLATAARVLHVDPEWLADWGLNHLTHADDPVRGPLFDYHDLHNAALLSGSGRTVPELARRFLMRFADSPPESWYEPRTWLVTVRPPRGPECGGHGSQVAGFAVPDPNGPGVELLDPALVPDRSDPHPDAAEGYQPRPYQVLVRLAGSADSVRDARVRAVYDEVVDALADGHVGYQAVAEHLRARHLQAWDLGMADCVVAGRLLAERIAGLGLRARARRGYMLGLLGSDHAWCEVFEDGRWKALDPVFAYLAADTADGRRFREACCGSRFNRLLPCAVPGAAPLMLGADGEPLPPWALGGVGARAWEESR